MLFFPPACSGHRWGFSLSLSGKSTQGSRIWARIGDVSQRRWRQKSERAKTQEVETLSASQIIPF